MNKLELEINKEYYVYEISNKILLNSVLLNSDDEIAIKITDDIFKKILNEDFVYEKYKVNKVFLDEEKMSVINKYISLYTLQNS